MELSPSLMIASAELPGCYLIISKQHSAALPPLPHGSLIHAFCSTLVELIQLSLERFQHSLVTTHRKVSLPGF